ncbi:uncharacterized protein LOC131605262 [Vicia villosa]|uniref:uncharacterized protein LOC131605262 n=1 Tax=Vicia villosa TaxID=3911 RepID=UPI00273CA6A5|nr:uncharacterized protein LOC131605262 [Vicia villosa]
MAGKTVADMEEEEKGSEGMGDDLESEYGEITVEEEWIGGYECPNFIFSEKEAKRIQKPWKRGVIVKLLGKRIGYKALENRLNQMWVRRGVISIIDLSNDYYLVAFSHEDDKKAAMENGLISDLPIEYYDPRALAFFGDRIGKTVKVDNTTRKQERGRYARICVTVNLSKPLVAMLKVQACCYKIEYEGLHLLCLACGCYGHYKENCPLANTGRNNEGDNSGIGGRNLKEIVGDKKFEHGGSSVESGPWRIVQKQRRGKKPGDSRKNTAPGSFMEKINAGGSRFLILEDEDTDINANEGNLIASKEEGINENSKSIRGGKANKGKQVDINDAIINLDLMGEIGKESVKENVEGSDRGIKGRSQRQAIKSKKSNLATRGGVQVREKAGGISQSGMEVTFGKYKSGDINETNMYNLKRREKGDKIGDKKDRATIKEGTDGSDGLASKHLSVREPIDIEKPLDLNMQTHQMFHISYEGSTCMRHEATVDGATNDIRNATMEEDNEVVKETPLDA